MVYPKEIFKINGYFQVRNKSSQAFLGLGDFIIPVILFLEFVNVTKKLCDNRAPGKPFS